MIIILLVILSQLGHFSTHRQRRKNIYKKNKFYCTFRHTDNGGIVEKNNILRIDFILPNKFLTFALKYTMYKKMKKITIIFLLPLLFLFACEQGTSQSVKYLNVSDFSKKINENKDAQILDVRTSGEFAENHLTKAINIDWNGNDFLEKIKFLEKEKPVFVYCLSGGRSGSAAQKLTSLGFKEVYNMEGGIAKWKANQLPLEQKNNASNGMTEKDFEQILSKKDFVLIDFTAAWCAPCKKLKPILEKISVENKNINIVPIDYDENTEIVQKYKIEAIPMLMIFQKGKKVWENQGFLSEEKIKEAIKKLGI
ncbi:MAG: thioredoxin [Bacteroidetes bacterium]|nr:MAG: thioredoxin [Bacteroidota bacterium]